MILTSIDRAMKLFELLSKYPKGLRLIELSEMMDVNQSSLHHIISTVSPYGYIQQDPDTKKYALGYRFVSLAKVVLDNLEIRDISHKHLEGLSGKIKGVFQISIMKGNKIVYVDKKDYVKGLTLVTYEGVEMDPYAAASGKVLLANMEDYKLTNMLKGVEESKLSSREPKTMDQYLEELKQIREQGYAFDDEEYYNGIRCVAVPIYSGDSVIASLILSSSIFDYTKEEMLGEVKKMVLEVAHNISKELK